MNSRIGDVAGGSWRVIRRAPREGGSRKLPRKTKVLLAISITIAVTLLGTVVFLNLRAGEKQIRYELTHRFAVNDPPFVPSMDHLLGPNRSAAGKLFDDVAGA